MRTRKNVAKTNSSHEGKTVKITEVRTYTPLSHDYADLFANMVAALELCAATEELLEIWKEKLKDENSKQLLQRMIVILFRYLGYPEGRAFSLYQHRGNREFLEMAKEIRDVEKELETISINKQDFKRLERIEKKLNQLAKNCRMEIERLAKTETIEYSQ
jgi:di/tripeptidase